MLFGSQQQEPYFRTWTGVKFMNRANILVMSTQLVSLREIVKIKNKSICVWNPTCYGDYNIRVCHPYVFVLNGKYEPRFDAHLENIKQVNLPVIWIFCRFLFFVLGLTHFSTFQVISGRRLLVTDGMITTL